MLSQVPERREVLRRSALILGGDITGKSLVPIERTPRGWSATFDDHVYTDIGEDEREALEQSVRDDGAYPVVGDHDELLRLEDEEHRESDFIDAVVSRSRAGSQSPSSGSPEPASAASSPLATTTSGRSTTPEASDVVEFVEGRTCV